MRRTAIALLVSGLVVGGGAAAFVAASPAGAATSPAKEQLRSCIRQARRDHRGNTAADKIARRQAVRECFRQAGVKRPGLLRLFPGIRAQVRALTPEKKAALEDCVKAARQAHHGDRPALREAVKSCLSQAGITLPQQPS